MQPIISCENFQKLNRENLIIINAGSGDSAYKNYLQNHILGAFYVDLNKDLAEIPANSKNGGRHPLPSVEKFMKVLQKFGIDGSSHIIIYDDKNASNAAARFWWMLKSAGIEYVQVLDGGLQNAINKGISVDSAEVLSPKSSNFSFKKWKLPTVDIDFVEKIFQNPNFLVVDVRENHRYNGKTEPIDLVAGHIPGAVNVPFKENLNPDGTFKNPAELRKKYSEIFKNIPTENIVFHCGSGVTACHSLLAIAHAGMEIPNLYVGSWSEWSRNGKEIVTGNF